MSSSLNLIQSLSAAEVLMLLFPRRSDAVDLLKITFSELCFLGVFEVKHEYEYASHHSDRLTGYNFVYFNRDKFLVSNLQPHHLILTSILEQEERLKLTTYSKRLGKTFKRRSDYKVKFIFKALESKNLLKEFFAFSRFLDLYSTQEKTKNELNRLTSFIEKAEAEFPIYLENSYVGDAQALLEELGNHVLLLSYIVVKKEIEWGEFLPKIQELVSTHFNHQFNSAAIPAINYLGLSGFSFQIGLDFNGVSFGGGDFGGGGASGEY